MRFTNQTSLVQVLKYSSQRLTRILTVPVTNGYRKVRRILNPNGFTTRVMSDVRKGSKEVINGKPQSLADYFAVGSYYIAKKLVYLLAILILVLPVLYLKFVYPVLRAHFLTVTMPMNSTEMIGYTGKVKLLTAKGGTLLYQGRLEEGRITGKGLLYDYDENLVYQGEFLMEQYEGSGQTFWPNGKTQYKGAFANNAYEGAGRLFRENGSLLYDGAFAGGVYEGFGTEWNADGQTLYTGNFSAGQYDGEGSLYQNGKLLYHGGFKAGQMDGSGKLYSGGIVIYEGEFAGGAFEGAGREYDPIQGRLLYDGTYAAGQYDGDGKLFDAETGALTYEGGFYQGAYEGDGKLFDPATGFPLYVGTFRAGRYDGSGTEYDAALGAPVYAGEFLMGVYHGSGKQYDPATGFVTAAGEYRNGSLVIIGEDGLPVGEITAPSGDNGGAAGGGSSTPSGSGTTNPSGGSAGTQSGGTQGGTETGKPSGAKVYTGPATASGGIDYAALAAMTPSAVKQQFFVAPTAWKVPDGGVQVYTDKTDGVGLAVRMDSTGKTVSVDVWNDAAVAGGAKTGMTKAELSAVLGVPKATQTEAMGMGRMISVSQSNRYFGRLTNISPESTVSVLTYQTSSGKVQAIFAGKTDRCLLLEVLP